ncbi:MAG: LysR family transcriptional regulator [bacterium]|nr:LysR family transcriptional regulator [bacterium]
MDLYQLKAFHTLVREGSFTRAAAALHITQSAVSHAIKRLESSAGTQLVRRGGKPFRLTEAGEALRRSCELIFHEIDLADEELEFHRTRVAQTVKIGAPVEFGTTILITHIRDFLEINPNIHLDFQLSSQLEEPLLGDDLDFIIDCQPHNLPDITRIHLFKERYSCIASPEFVEKYDLRNLEDLSEVSLLSCDKRLTWWRNFFDAIPEATRPGFRHVIQINHIRGLINGAICGLGVGFVPLYTVFGELADGILVDPFPQIKPETDRFDIFIKTRKLELRKNQLVIDYLRGLNPSELSG